ncbi:PrsW family glutamic-type intramembrane protease [Paeniglutamicibacter cryotolerans]|uniref:RsiW-degrading membrane proteinase PrsW (M82 family) n=1 Tax=Paeniglutamicibacter cryotolerans TaxID=670079 RepID=A0A839QU51_9MICC|nr:PrsW family glutamic-type intramembrane protease [Paeniglutamicibacter cryotolerans]MBB2996802.1 RsiW-degrading membrane proteinase PrsW (M82 family) [Paeniglutamicibacter cryotolerans]
MSTVTAGSTTAHTKRHGWWWKTLVVGFVLWGLTVWVTAVTLNSNLIPTLILLGSFLVPFCVVMFVLERVSGNLSTIQVIRAFVIGGICGVLGASLLESDLKSSVFTYVGVGFIEEFVKGAILLVVGWRILPKTAGQGALLGAAVGAGFAAFESAGYAFNSVITAQGLDLVTMLQTEALRAILTPVGHVLWTAILGAALFGAARGRKHYRFAFSIIGAYVGVALLHGLWDSLGGLTTLLALLITGTTIADLKFGFITAGSQAHAASLASILYVVGIVITAVIGILVLWLILRHHHKADRAHAVTTASGYPDPTPVPSSQPVGPEEA